MSYHFNRNCIVGLVLVGFTVLPASGQVSSSDFLPPVRGGTTEVQDSTAVELGGDTVKASTSQDAINAAMADSKEGLEKNDTPAVGAKMVVFPSGLGFVATGAGTYRELDNPVATRIAKRQAYVIAFTQAKKNLAEILGGLSSKAREEVRENLLNVNLPDDEMTNISVESVETLEQVVDMMMRGFVIYAVLDSEGQNTVYVTVVTTPKTRGKLARLAPNVVESKTLKEGLNQVLDEIRTGLVAPVGGRIVMVVGTGETAFVGFGSSVVRTSKNNAAQAKLNLSTQKIANMRSKDALCGLIIGDQSLWKGTVIESMKDEMAEFEEITADDPLAKDNEAGYRKLEHARETFVAKIQSTDVYVSARNGILPPGINTRSWFDEDHAWAYAVSVYIPSVTNAASGAARDMQDAQLLQPIQSEGRETDGGFRDQNNSVARPTEEVKKGPSGKVASDDDL